MNKLLNFRKGGNVVTALCLLSVLSVITLAQAQSERNWTKGFRTQPADKQDPAGRFFLMFAKQEKLHLIGGCNYENYVVSNQAPRRVTIEGAKIADAIFWPDVALQVSNDGGEWQTIGQAVNDGQPDTIMIEPKGVAYSLLVNLDAFKPMIGKYKFGRLLLKTGEAADFRLDALLPPPNAP